MECGASRTRQGACIQSMRMGKSGPSDGRTSRGPSTAGHMRSPPRFGGISRPPSGANGGEHIPGHRRYITAAWLRHAPPSRN
eukprot:4355590-Alexandrium_andersonii.AAC.1